MRILALDWGEVRIGLAISDEDQKIAFPLDKVIDRKDAIAEIKSLILQYDIGKVILGFPKNLSGQEGTSAEKVKLFAAELNKETGARIEFIDERFSSVGATKTLTAVGMPEKEQRQIKDNIVAQQMLQQYLDNSNQGYSKIEKQE
jgi:putative holliday junction resolvase